MEAQGDGVAVVDRERYLGLDCEMVGVGSEGKRSALARVTLVDFEGRVVYDEHVRPVERVTDFRTWVSGVKAKHLKEAAISLKEVGDDGGGRGEDSIRGGRWKGACVQSIFSWRVRGCLVVDRGWWREEGPLVSYKYDANMLVIELGGKFARRGVTARCTSLDIHTVCVCPESSASSRWASWCGAR